MGSDVLPVEETFGWQQLTSQLLTNFLPHTKKLPQATNQVTWGSRWN